MGWIVLLPSTAPSWSFQEEMSRPTWSVQVGWVFREGGLWVLKTSRPLNPNFMDIHIKHCHNKVMKAFKLCPKVPKPQSILFNTMGWIVLLPSTAPSWSFQEEMSLFQLLGAPSWKEFRLLLPSLFQRSFQLSLFFSLPDFIIENLALHRKFV